MGVEIRFQRDNNLDLLFQVVNMIIVFNIKQVVDATCWLNLYISHLLFNVIYDIIQRSSAWVM